MPYLAHKSPTLILSGIAAAANFTREEACACLSGRRDHFLTENVHCRTLGSANAMGGLETGQVQFDLG